MEKRTRNKSFRKLLEENEVSARLALMKKARIANSLAKIGNGRRNRVAAYLVKESALNHGLEMGLFVARSDEKSRSNLLRISSGGRSALHLPVERLSGNSKSILQVRAVLGQIRSEVA
ncbi:MAG: hypothetical protein H8E43_11295 [Planctomycetia bacterium]|nr:hypothetical protein [Planctomycetia bacterium]MDC0852883.1 hypothetical protein [Planctomycetota bacterium]